MAGGLLGVCPAIWDEGSGKEFSPAAVNGKAFALPVFGRLPEEMRQMSVNSEVISLLPAFVRDDPKRKQMPWNKRRGDGADKSRRA